MYDHVHVAKIFSLVLQGFLNTLETALIPSILEFVSTDFNSSVI